MNDGTLDFIVSDNPILGVLLVVTFILAMLTLSACMAGLVWRCVLRRD
jgi:hypothetical protein